MQLTEAEIRGLCLKCRKIFLGQPMLLELEAPFKICGEGWGVYACTCAYLHACVRAVWVYVFMRACVLCVCVRMRACVLCVRA